MSNRGHRHDAGLLQFGQRYRALPVRGVHDQSALRLHLKGLFGRALEVDGNAIGVESGNGREWGRFGFEDDLEVKSMLGHEQSPPAQSTLDGKRSA